MFFIVLSSIMTAMGLYVSIRLIRPLPIAWWLRLLLCALVLLCANKVVLLRWLAPGGISLKLPYSVLVGTAWLHISVVLMFFVGLAVDVLRLLLHLVLRRANVSLFTPVLRLVAVGLIASLLAGIGIRNAVSLPRVEEIRVSVRQLPADLQNMRIALLADLHLGPLFGEDWAREVVRLTNQEKPDLIVIAGDIVDDTPRALAAASGQLAGLQARHGVYAIVGNHEYYAGLDPWRMALPRLGMKLLFNQHAVIPVGTARLVLAGLPDRITLRGFPGEKPDLDKALSGAPERDAQTVRIVLDHQPSGAPEHAAKGMDMQFSGHTHGGLVLGIRRIVAQFNGGFVSGQYEVGGMRLVVSNGTGLWAGMPLRLGVPAQIAIIKLVPAE